MSALPRSFPFPLRIGTDICQISRIRRIITGPNSRRFMMRVIVPGEQRPPQLINALHAVEENKIEGNDMLIDKCATWLAGRWAAKEAVIKAHRRKLYMKDIMIAQASSDSNENHPPVALIQLSHSEKFKNSQAVVQLSISHDGDYATATCLAYDSWAKEDWIRRWETMSQVNKKTIGQVYEEKGWIRREKWGHHTPESKDIGLPGEGDED